LVRSSWNVMAHGDAREGKWSGNWRMEWIASTLHTTSERVSSITTADAHTSAASSHLNWRPRRFKWTRQFRRKTKSGFCACAITFQVACNSDCHFHLSPTFPRQWHPDWWSDSTEICQSTCNCHWLLLYSVTVGGWRRVCGTEHRCVKESTNIKWEDIQGVTGGTDQTSGGRSLC